MLSMSSSGTSDAGTTGVAVSLALRVAVLRAGFSAETLEAFPVGVGATLSGALALSPPTAGLICAASAFTDGFAVTTVLSGFVLTRLSTTAGIVASCVLRLREAARALRAALMFSSFMVKSPLQKKRRDARPSDAPRNDNVSLPGKNSLNFRPQSVNNIQMELR